jgi:Flp pilus assembly secretin CpaC
MRPLYPLIPFALAFIVAGAARAESLSVALDHSTRLHVNNASSVVVGDATVADVTVVDGHTVFVQGRNYGSTAIIVNDRDGRTVFSGDITVVRPEQGVSVYRGLVRSDFACAPDCTAVQHTLTVPLNGVVASAK